MAGLEPIDPVPALDDMSQSGPLVRGSEIGIPRREVAVGTLGRFLPASVLPAGLFVAFEFAAHPELWLPLAEMLAVAIASLAGGFALGLEAMRRWLRTDADVTGRRSVVAGVCGSLALFTLVILDVFELTYTTEQALVYGLVAGLMLAVLVFFPWLTKSSGRSDLYHKDALELANPSGSRGTSSQP